MVNIPWDDRPPADIPERFGVQVYRLLPGEEAFIRLLGPWKGCWHHWLQRSSGPCMHPLRDCPHCPDDKRFWEGYCPALRWNPRMQDPTTLKYVGGWQQVVFPVFAAMAVDLRRLSDGVTGLVMKVERAKGRKKWHTWELLERTHKAYLEPMGQPFDVVPILMRMWQMFMFFKDRSGTGTRELLAWENDPLAEPPGEPELH